jgi:glyoxylase-like metal-dependent hydrolase (beta-lactamase superfamily II)
MISVDTPVMLDSRALGDSWHLLPSFMPVPGMGALAVNSFLLGGEQPMLVDTGLGALGDAFLFTLDHLVGLDDLQWIWISHLDADHTGNLERLLSAAPNARVLTSFLGMGKMNLAGLDVSRVELLMPGTPFNIGDRSLIPIRPVYYDAPETLGFFDDRSGALFAVDSFGALLPGCAETFNEITDATLLEGLASWSAIDAPWLCDVAQQRFGQKLASIADLSPKHLLTAHLPPVGENIHPLLDHMRRVQGNMASAARQEETAQSELQQSA